MKKWFYIELNTKKGPVSDEALRKLHGEGKVLYTTLIRAKGMNSWEPLSKHLKDLPQVSVIELLERPGETQKKARIHLAKSESAGIQGKISCVQCNQAWPPQHVFITTTRAICLPCKIKLEQTSAKILDAAEPWYRGPIVPLLLVIALGVFIVYVLPRWQAGPEGVAMSTHIWSSKVGRPVADGVPLWQAQGANRTQEPWANLPPDQWPPLVSTVSVGQTGAPLRPAGSGFLIQVDSSSLLAAARPALPPEIKQKLAASKEGIARAGFELVAEFPRVAPSEIQATPALATASSPALAPPAVDSTQARKPYLHLPETRNLGAPDTVFYVYDVGKETILPSKPLRLRTGKLTPGETLYVPYAVRGAGGIGQSVATGRTAMIGSKAESVQVQLDAPVPYAQVLGAPLLDDRGFVVGIVTGSSQVEGGTSRWLAADSCDAFIPSIEANLGALAELARREPANQTPGLPEQAPAK